MTNPNFGMSRKEPMAAATASPARILPCIPEAIASRETRRNECGFGGAGGTITYRLRPSHRIMVEMNMSTPGMPNAIAGPSCLQEDRHQKRREERAEVDDPVEGVEDHFRAMLVRLIELVADERGDTRFDSARAERDQPESDIEARCDW